MPTPAFLNLTGSEPTKGVARTEMCDLEIDEGAVILLFDANDRLMGLRFSARQAC